MTEQPLAKPAGQKVRIATGLGLGLGALLVVLFSPYWLLTLIVMAIAILGMKEYLALMLAGSSRLEAFTGLMVAALLPLSALAGPLAVAAALGLSFTAMAAAAMAKGGELDQALSRFLRLFGGGFYLGGFLGCMLLLAGLAQGRLLLVYLIAVVAAADTGAYFTGRRFGRHKMAPRISPKKTLEGLAGGLILAGLLGAGFSALLLSGIGPAAGGLLGLSLGGLSVLGDLFESLMKRVAGVKDSGALLPGHGGVLDRLDGLLLAGPGLLLARVMLWP
jgi:phosphatidate cytidylyltransferase